MMRYIFLFLSVIFSVFINAQTKVELGSDHPIDKKGFAYIYQYDESGIYFINNKIDFLTGRNVPTLDRYQNYGEYNFIETIQMPITDEGEHVFTAYIQTEDSNYILSSIASSGSHKLYSSKIDDGSIIGDPVLLKEVKQKLILETGDFVASFHESSQKLLVTYKKAPGLAPTNIFEFSIFDNSMNLVVEDEMELPYRARNILFTDDYFLDNDGNLIMPLEIEKIKKEKGQQEESFILFVYDISKKRMKEYKFSLKNKIILPNRFDGFNYKVNLTKNGKIKIIGLYSDSKKREIKGIFDLELNKKNGVFNEKIYEFEKDVLTKLIGKKAADKGGGLTKYNIDHFIEQENGGYFVVAENRYSYSSASNTGRLILVCKDVLVLSIGAKADLNWIKVIPKHTNNVGGSYILNYNSTKEMLNFAYLDLLANLDSFKYYKEINTLNSSNANQAVLVQTSIDKDGAINRDLVKTSFGSLVSSVGMSISDTEFIFQARQSNNRLRIGKIIFEN